MNIYKYLSKCNDLKAIRKGRILQRIWNKFMLKFVRRFMK